MTKIENRNALRTNSEAVLIYNILKLGQLDAAIKEVDDGINNQDSAIFPQISDDHNSQIINISSLGLAFFNEKTFNDDTLLAIIIKLKSIKNHVMCIGKVVTSTKDDNELNRISIEFVRITQKDKTLLDDHVHASVPFKKDV